jgi:hypothetical protein
MAFIGMPRVLVLVGRYRLWPRMSVAKVLRRVKKRGASLFGGLKPCHYYMYAKIPSDFNIWQVIDKSGL